MPETDARATMGGRGPALWLAALLLFALTVPAGAAESLTIGVLKLASSGPVFIAVDRGYFAAQGLAPELRFFDAAQPVAVGTVAGDVDIGVTGLTAGFYNLAGKGALRIVGAQSREAPGYHLVAYIASDRAYDAGLTRLAALPGHSVAISQVGSTFHYSLGLLAEKLGFPLASLRLLPLQSMGNMAAAVKGNQADAALLPATLAVPLAASGGAHILGWVGDETPWQLGAIFTRARTIAERRAAVAGFIAAYRRAAHDFYDAFLVKGADGRPHEGPEAGALLAIIAKYTGQSPAQIRNGIPYIDPDARLLVDDIDHQVAWYQSQGLVDKSVDATSLLDLSFIGQKP
ncbi:MAG TPA: ABC transporter substrate-binding protein [Stellaceae bacterium]|nr:ABC transporter substrate-binding protein [Stellaceae bacterium]